MKDSWTKKELEDLMIHENAIKIYFEEGESGWAYKIGDGLAIIGNTPLAEHLGLMDVVKLTPGSGLRMAGEVVFRLFPCKSCLRYTYDPNDQDGLKARYKAIYEALQGAGMLVEGWMAGYCGVSHNEEDDIMQVLKDAGFDLHTVWVEEYEDEEEEDEEDVAIQEEA